MEYRYYGILSVILFLKFNLLVEGETTDLLGGDYNQLSIKCHPLLTLLTRGKITLTGDLLADGFIYTKDYYEKYNDTHYRVCICDVRACLRRCCAEGEIISNETKQCERSERHYDIKTDVYDNENKLIPNYDLSKFYKVYGNTCPNKKFILDPSNPDDAYFLRYDGRLSVPGMGEGLYHTDFFCFEIIAGEKDFVQGAFLCFPENSEADQEPQFTAYPIGMMISIPFLLATFLVYALIPELRNLHGKNSMCHVSSLLTAYIFLVIIQLKSDSLNQGFCIACGFIIQFSFLASFFWLNVMCFDIWYCFSGFRGFGGLKGSTKERECIRFLIYSIYAWGAPAFLLTISLIMDLSPNIPDYVLKPNIGKIRCFFDTKMATLAYFYGPMAVLLIANTVLFLLTAIKIFAIRKETQVLSGNESRQNNEANKQRFILYLKLFLVMGINWMLEVISWAVDGPKWVWYVTDVCNTLQGLFIFLIFVCKKRIKKLILLRIRPSMLPRDVETTTSSLKMSMSRNSSVVIGPTGEGNISMNSCPVRKTSNEYYK